MEFSLVVKDELESGVGGMVNFLEQNGKEAGSKLTKGKEKEHFDWWKGQKLGVKKKNKKLTKKNKKGGEIKFWEKKIEKIGVVKRRKWKMIVRMCSKR